MNSSPGSRRNDLPRLYPVYPPNNSTENTNVDIVAVHGLETWSPRTWIGQKDYGTPNAGKEVNWLSDPDMLHENIPGAKIWVYDYNSNYSRDAPETRLEDVGSLFLDSLMAEEIGKRPLVFIGSCFGGIVIVQALVKAHRNEKTYTSFLHSILGVVFLGTPLRGTPLTTAAEREIFVRGILGETTSSKTLLSEIKELSNTLEALVDDFADMARELNYEIRCFFETKKTQIIRRVFRSGPLSNLEVPGAESQLLVTRRSATLDGYPKTAMDVPHVMMNKFTGPDELRFKVLVKEIKTIAEATRRHRFDKEEAKILSSLFSDYEAGKDANPDQVSGTCLWFIDHPNFTNWRDETSETAAKLLWATADPGCGKSVLAKTLIDKSLLSTETIHVTTCYFFFKEDDTSRNRGIHALRSILHQLFMQKPELIEFAKSDYKTKGESLFSTLTSLWETLERCATSLKIGKIICVVDALDECLETDRYLLIRLLRELDAPERRTKKNLKVVVTCRPYHDIVGAFNDSTYGNRSIRLEGEKETEKIRKEIDKVIEHEISRIVSRQDSQFDHEVQQALIKYLKDMEHHTYLWLHLIMEELRKTLEYSTPELLGLLRSIPRNIEQAYENILKKVDRNHKKEARQLLSIIVAAVRPMTMKEMHAALGIAKKIRTKKELGVTQLAQSREKAFEHRIRNLCGLFVNIHDSKIYLIHQTARSFLIDLPESNDSEDKDSDSSASPVAIVPHPSLRAERKWKHSILMKDSHRLLADICIWYLQLPDFEFKNTFPGGQATNVDNRGFDSVVSTIITRYEFLQYSAKNWPIHFRGAFVDQDQSYTASALQLCDTESQHS
ncbi:hypothetical protein BP5796_12638 [Coleophoma crateriformis]|uniref:NACHT domain-containing protein n=1 Tax=Coleophoma crateriformis TaxID=565419 RepID=A0A3D8Q812_9HELO|nr:hypothetical protein BP5796_12638 [Coleophoma crateriformis]